MTQIEVTIEPVRVALLSHNHTVILKQKRAKKYLPFCIDKSQGYHIAGHLQKWPDRNVQLDMFLANSNASNARVKNTTIHIEDDTYYATILLSQRGQSSEIKCPIGIGIAMALRARAPILVDEETFQKASIYLPHYKESWWSRRRLYQRLKKRYKSLSVAENPNASHEESVLATTISSRWLTIFELA